MKVIKRFYCTVTREHYEPGDEYNADEARLNKLIDLGLLEQVNSYSTLTKTEIMDLLDESGIEYGPRMSKSELISLLE